jgi:hypothetical protein
MLAHSDANSDFRYDELARQLKVRGLNGLTRTALEQLCREEGLFAARQVQDPSVLSVAVRSFLGPASDIVGASPDNTLLLTDHFRQRYLRDDLDWQADIRPKVEAFLRERVRTSSGRLRLILDAHSSIAFLAGATLDLKSGVFVELVQKGRVGARSWRPDDGTASSGAALDVAVHDLNEGRRVSLPRTLSARRMAVIGARSGLRRVIVSRQSRVASTWRRFSGRRMRTSNMVKRPHMIRLAAVEVSSDVCHGRVTCYAARRS